MSVTPPIIIKKFYESSSLSVKFPEIDSTSVRWRVNWKRRSSRGDASDRFRTKSKNLRRPPSYLDRSVPPTTPWPSCGTHGLTVYFVRRYFVRPRWSTGLVTLIYIPFLFYNQAYKLNVCMLSSHQSPGRTHYNLSGTRHEEVHPRLRRPDTRVTTGWRSFVPLRQKVTGTTKNHMSSKAWRQNPGDPRDRTLQSVLSLPYHQGTEKVDVTIS